MTLNLDSEDLLYRLACECEGLFDHLQEILPKTMLEVTIINLFADFQQRFSIWGAHLGVFARKSQCLDTRLRNLPDLQDLVARLLDILRRSLQQCKNEANNQEEAYQAPMDFDESHRKASIQMAALTAIDNTLSRLNRLGVTIRRSSHGKIDMRAKIFTAALDLDSFAYLCAKAVHALYPDAHQSLKDYLCKSMIDRYGKILFLNSRHKKLETRREPRLGLSPILEYPNNETQTNVPMAQPARAIPVVANLQKPHPPLSRSDLSSVNIQEIKRRLRLPYEASTNFHKTTSVQVNQGNYPRPPVANGDNDNFACDWCSELLNKKTLSESEWRRHIDRDLKPYICLSEECPEAHPIYSTFNEWFGHMELHNRRWHQQVYLSSSWVCTVCEFNPDVYSSPEALYSHLKESHDGDFTNKQLQVISRQSKTAQSRTWNDCLLCCFAVEEHGNSGEAVFSKRRKESDQQTAESAGKTHAMMNPGHHSSDADCSDLSSDSDDIGPHRHRQQQSKDRSEAVARHIAVHLQMLMLLTLRFAALQKDDGVLDDDIKSDSVDIDDGNSASKGNDLGRLSDLVSQADVYMKDMDGEDNEGDAMDIDDDFAEDDFPIPDTDLDLKDVPRQCDGLAAEDDAFLKKVIESGAYQSWRDAYDMAEDEFLPITRLPVPTFEGFRAQIMQWNPRLEPALIHRFANAQVQRYNTLVELQQKHSAAVANRNCKSSKFCSALGGQPVLLQQQKTLSDAEAGQTQFRITDYSQESDQPYVAGEGAIAAAQFPPGVPLPPVSRLPAQFECPICFQVKKFQKASDWTKHVHEDLQLFTCSFPGCMEPKSFKRKADWVRHENEQHRQFEWWTCSYPDCMHTCYRKNNFIQHLVREHKLPEPRMKKIKELMTTEGSAASQREQEFWQIVTDCWSGPEQTPSKEPCRFCGNVCSSWKKLTVHLGKHMEQLAMPVLELARQSSTSSFVPIVSGSETHTSALAAPALFHNHPEDPSASVQLAGQQYSTNDSGGRASHASFSYFDMPIANHPSTSDTKLSMEPESIDDQFPSSPATV